MDATECDFDDLLSIRPTANSPQ